MTDPARGPTTEELRARVLAAQSAISWTCACGRINPVYVLRCDDCGDVPPADVERGSADR